jgi:hypothetical protein
MVQNWIESNFDAYTIRARLRPALIVILPVALAVLIFFPNDLTNLGLLVSLIVAFGGTYLLSQIGRNMGKSKEDLLFAQWEGGKPTTRILRHSTSTNLVILEQRHNKLKKLFPSLKIPNISEESKLPEKADQIYDACVKLLIGKTRDKDKFPLVFEELCNYGFCRNLWGMRPLGITTSIIGLLVSIGFMSTNFWILKSPIPPFAIICSLFSFLLLFLWVFVFTPLWVKVAADAYAERLLESCEIL